MRRVGKRNGKLTPVRSAGVGIVEMQGECVVGIHIIGMGQYLMIVSHVAGVEVEHLTIVLDGFLSSARFRQQAGEFGDSRLDEIRILMLHGVLHLIGMDHENDGGAMARAEARWRKKLDLPAGLIARTL